MTDNSRTYTEEKIIALCAAIKGEQKSFDWLMAHCKELAALCDVLVYSSDKALNWLQQNGYPALYAFLCALNEDDDAFQFLMNGPYKEWAATVNAVNENESATAWLLRFGFPYYAALAETLLQRKDNTGSSA